MSETAGLTAEQARVLLAQVGPNAMPEERTSAWRRLAPKFWAPVPWMLEAAIVLQLALGERVEAAVIAVLLVFNALLGFVQESRAHATLEALQSRLALMASVRRDGRWQSVPARELVPGDVIKLSLGSVVGADVRLLEGDVLLDQSMLTGESLPVEAGAGRETYAGALVRRGEAVAIVTATGRHTRFGRTAELVRTAQSHSAQQQVVLRVVRNLALFNGALVFCQLAYGATLELTSHELIRLTLTAVLAAIPVALPATFTLAGALGARELARVGVLPTRLSAVDEAGTLDVLCSDKTGTLTQSALRVTGVYAAPGYDENRVLTLAALASADGGLDPVDAAVRAAAPATTLQRQSFQPFDPATKLAEAGVLGADGEPLRIVKGAPARVLTLTSASATPALSTLLAADERLASAGQRVLAVAEGPAQGKLRPAGLIALSDPPRSDSHQLIEQLRSLGVRTVMVSGDVAATARAVAEQVGLQPSLYPHPHIQESEPLEGYTVFAGVFPEDKFHLVRGLQRSGHTVGMCGDGANDAPALRQAQIGIAVASATDVAKSAAGIVLTEPGLGGIVSAVQQGRLTYQRILVYVLRSMTLKIGQMLLLAIGLAMTGRAILTPLLMVLVVISGDFLAMSATTDRVQPPAAPERWHINQLTLIGAVLGLGYLCFCAAVLAVGRYRLQLPLAELRTLATVALVFGGQAAYYAIRTRGWLWSTRPSGWVALSSIANVAIIATLAAKGWLMTPLSIDLLAGVFLAAVLFAPLFDVLKRAVAARLSYS